MPQKQDKHAKTIPIVPFYWLIHFKNDGYDYQFTNDLWWYAEIRICL